MLRNGTPFLKTPATSQDEYEKYDDREQRAEDEGRGWYCIVDGRIQWMRAKDIRGRYLEPIAGQIDAELKQKRPLYVLEVGCGNCCNLVRLRERYGERVVLSGIDISAKRIDVARRYYGERLNDVDLRVGSVTAEDFEGCLEGRRFDFVFSMHCLEQIPYDLKAALKNMARVTSGRLAMVEPVFEFGNPVQKLSLLISDHAKVLLPTALAMGFNIVRAEPLTIQASPKNQSSLIIIDCHGSQE